MKLFTFLAFIIFAFDSNAHHVVSMITQTQKIVVLPDDGQQVLDGRVSTKTIIKHGKNERASSAKEIDKHMMPQVGSKINIYRYKSINEGTSKQGLIKFEKNYIGTATIIDADLSNEVKVIYLSKKEKIVSIVKKEEKFSKSELEKIKKTAIVAIPDEGVEVQVNDRVEFETK